MATSAALKKEPTNYTPADRLIGIREVEQIVGRKKSVIYERMASGTFPPQHPHFPGMWPESAVLNYVRTGEIK